MYKHRFISCLDLSKAQRSFANVLNGFGLECIGEVETDDEMIIGEFFNKVNQSLISVNHTFQSGQ